MCGKATDSEWQRGDRNIDRDSAWESYWQWVTKGDRNIDI